MSDQQEQGSILSESGGLSARLTTLEGRLETLEHSIEKMVKAWEAAGSVLTVIKWLSIVGAAVSTFCAAVMNGAFGHNHH